jgi:hypothetical protein
MFLLTALVTARCGQRTSPGPGPQEATAGYEKEHDLLLVGLAPPASAGSSIDTYASGRGETVITTSGDSPSWTPDGRIAFSSNRSGSQQIWIMDADGGNAAQVGNLPPTTLPLMAQMGRNGLIVFMGADANTQPDDNVGIWAMQKDGTGLQEVTRGMQPSLARSGTWIAFTLQTDSPYHREIWRINTDGTGLQQLTFLGDPDYPDANAPNISPDESAVAFFSGKESDRAAPGAPQESIFNWGYRNVATVPSAGGARKTLTPCHPVSTQAELDATSNATGNCVAADNPAWSPDGEWLICDTGFESGTETWMVDAKGQNFQSFYAQSRGIVRVALKPTN